MFHFLVVTVIVSVLLSPKFESVFILWFKFKETEIDPENWKFAGAGGFLTI